MDLCLFIFNAKSTNYIKKEKGMKKEFNLGCKWNKLYKYTGGVFRGFFQTKKNQENRKILQL